MNQQVAGSSAVIIQISPTLFFLTIATAVLTAVIFSMRQTRWITQWMTKVDIAIEPIPQLRQDRHQIKTDMMVVTSRVDALDKYVDEERQGSRDLQSAVAEFIIGQRSDRREGEERRRRTDRRIEE